MASVRTSNMAHIKGLNAWHFYIILSRFHPQTLVLNVPSLLWFCRNCNWKYWVTKFTFCSRNALTHLQWNLYWSNQNEGPQGKTKTIKLNKLNKHKIIRLNLNCVCHLNFKQWNLTSKYVFLPQQCISEIHAQALIFLFLSL